MNRREALRGLAALPAAGLAVGGGRGIEPADHDVPFTHTLENGDRCMSAMRGCLAWDNPPSLIINARTGEEVERVRALNWDTPWVDFYQEDGIDLKRLFVPFYVEMEDGTRYRSANGD